MLIHNRSNWLIGSHSVQTAACVRLQREPERSSGESFTSHLHSLRFHFGSAANTRSKYTQAGKVHTKSAAYVSAGSSRLNIAAR